MVKTPKEMKTDKMSKPMKTDKPEPPKSAHNPIGNLGAFAHPPKKKGRK